MFIVLCGPIKHWWDENWNTPAHLAYIAHRELVNVCLVELGHLVYRPHEAFKGAWDEAAQEVNDCAIRLADAIIDLTPPDTPSVGTDDEMALCESIAKPIIKLPPGPVWPLLEWLDEEEHRALA